MQYSKTILLVFVLLSNYVVGQTPSLSWINSLPPPEGHTSASYYSNVKVNDEGDIYTFGAFSDTVLVEGVEYIHNGHTDFILQKMDADGNNLWVKTIGNEDGNYHGSLEIDNEGNLIIATSFKNTQDFDPGESEFELTSAGGWDNAVMKLDPSGELIWAFSFGNEELDNLQRLAIDLDNNIYLSGKFEGIVDFDFSEEVYELTSMGESDYSRDIFILKINSFGEFQWVKSIGSNDDQDHVYSIEISDNAILLSGYLGEGGDYDPGSETFYSEPGYWRSDFIEKLDLDGNFEWCKVINSVEGSSIRSVAVNDIGDIYACISHSEIIDLDPSDGEDLIEPIGDVDLRILKMDPNGNIQWTEFIGKNNSVVYGSKLYFDPIGHLYVLGYHKFNINVGLGEEDIFLQGSGSYNPFVLKMDTSGFYMWSLGLNHIYEQYFNDLEVLSNGTIYLAGSFEGEVDFDPSVNDYILVAHEIFNDAFIGKYNECLIDLTTEIVTSCEAYTWEETGMTYSTDGLYQNIFANENGCDSIIQLDLDILTIDTDINFEDLILTSEQPDATYQWLDCENDFEPISGANDQTYQPTSIGEYAVEITLNGQCSEISDCYEVDVVSLNELNLDYSFSIYPNPAENYFFFQSKNNQKAAEITIYDIIGKIVHNSLYLPKQIIDVSFLSAGSYLVQIDRQHSTKLIINR